MTETDKARIREHLHKARTSLLIVYVSDVDMFIHGLEKQGLIDGFTFTSDRLEPLGRMLADEIDRRIPIPP